MKKILIFVIVLFISSCNIDEELTIELNEYDLEVISYFKEITLGFENGEASEITRKWDSTMKIFIGWNSNSILLDELNKIIDEINEIVSDNFSAEIVSDFSTSNYYIYFGKGEEYAKIFPSQSQYVNNNLGLFNIWFDNDYINRGVMYVDIFRANEQAQWHLLREELTQSLGLAQDSERYLNSIFQINWTIISSYSQIDKDIIRLLYHPNMKVGLNENEVDLLLRSILLNEK
jgi:hypothetical protein